MADSRAQGLTKRTIDTLAKITGVRLWSGKTGDPDEKALGVEMSEMISSAIVAEGSAIDYQGMTPKAFALSVATESRKGIAMEASAANIAAETADKMLQANHQEAMRASWGTCETEITHLGQPKTWNQSEHGSAYIWNVAFDEVKADTTTTTYKISPVNRRFYHVMVSGVYFSDYYGGGSIDNQYLLIDSIDSFITFGGANFKLIFPHDAEPYIQSTAVGSIICALTIKGI